MFRFLCLVLLALALVQASGIELPGDADRCADRCPGEQKSGQCPPDCAWCGCCVGSRPILVAQTAEPESLERSGSVATEPAARQSMPDPREITHVPLSLS